MRKKSILELKQKDRVLNTVEIINQDVPTLFSQLKKQENIKYYAQYYFRLQLFNKKYKLIFFVDMIVNVFDTGKSSKYPYKVKFIAKRTSGLKSNKLEVINNKVSVEREFGQLLWLNKIRNDRIYKDEKYDIVTTEINDTISFYLHKKNDRYIKNDATIKIFNDSVFFFNYKQIPIRFEYISKFDLLDTESSGKKLKYNTFYLEKSLSFIKKLDANQTKKVKFNKGDKNNYSPIDSLPNHHPYLDTIPFPKL